MSLFDVKIEPVQVYAIISNRLVKSGLLVQIMRSSSVDVVKLDIEEYYTLFMLIGIALIMGVYLRNERYYE